MKYFFLFLLAVLPAHSAYINIYLNDPQTQESHFFVLENQEKISDISQFHENLIAPTSSNNIYALENSLEFDIKKTKIKNKIITRSTPIINNLPTEGITGIFYNNNNNNNKSHNPAFYYTYFDLPKTNFKLNPAEALEYALRYQAYSHIRNPYVEKIAGTYEKIWLMHMGELRPTYKTRLPALNIFNLKDIYIDGNNGEVLKIENSAFFDSAPAHAYVYSPNSKNLDQDGLKKVTLPNLLYIEEDDFLRGEYLDIKTCCEYFTCPKEGECNTNNKRCALKSHERAQQRREQIDLPTRSLGLDPLLSLPETISVDTVRCTYLPFARASFEKQNSGILGFYDQPIDEPGIESEMDRFSEIQAYFSVMSIFNHVRLLLQDNTWCLREQAMSCNQDGSPVLNQDGLPRNPYRVFVNQRIPDMKMEGEGQSDPESFIIQVLGGKGQPDNPINLSNLTRIGNAAFIPALSTLKETTPRADEILSDLIKPYDHNVFFQGDRDFAYDGDVVFHEFWHAVTTTLVGKLNSLGLSPWGIHSEPGSLNEGWSDYFAAAFSGDAKIGEYAAIEGGFGEAALRNIDNNKSCPKDIVGEIHNDAQVWAGALWEIREKLLSDGGSQRALEFDRAVLAALALAQKTEDFKMQSEKLLTQISQNSKLGPPATQIAKNILEKRGLTDCFRAFRLSEVDNFNNLETNIKNMLFVPSKTQIGLLNYAPSSSQLEIQIPAGAKSMTLSWKQFLGGTGALLGTETTPDSTSNIKPLGVISVLDQPINWEFKNKTAIPVHNGQELEHSGAQARYQNGAWSTSSPLSFERCEQKIMYVSLLSYDFKYVLENIKINFDLDKSIDRSDCDFTKSAIIKNPAKSSGCSTRYTSNSYLLFLFLGFAYLALRRKINNP